MLQLLSHSLSGHDAPLIAYDALLGGKDNWEEIALRGILHGGDNDSTGVIVSIQFIK
jgi:ADP-ribosylarginine hydrolase